MKILCFWGAVNQKKAGRKDLKQPVSDEVWTEGLDWGTGEDKEKNVINTKLQ